MALALCILASYPILEMGLNDDWSYIWSARVLAATGHVTYNGWSTAMLGWQLYLGALFIKLFGFSFTAVRASVLLVAMLNVALLHRLFVRFGLTEWNSTLATLTIALCPLSMALSASFMSDIPGFFVIILCLYMCVRAVQAESDRAVILWLVSAALVNALGGTVRQIAWLGVLVIVPATTFYLRRRRGALLTGAAACLISFLFILGCMHWFSLQPYSIVEKAFFLPTARRALIEPIRAIVRSITTYLLFLFPVFAAFLVKYPFQLNRARTAAWIAGPVFLLAFVTGISLHKTFGMIFASGSNNTSYFCARGVFNLPDVLGNQPDVLSHVARFAISFIVWFAFSAFLFSFWNAPLLENRIPLAKHPLPTRAVTWLLLPFTAATLLLLATRLAIFDRYLLPLFVVGLIVVLRFYQRRIADRLPSLTVVLIALFALLGISVIHDTFAMDRARVAAADELRRAGVPRSDIRAGFEYDAWTELERTGYVNDLRLRVPAGAYHPKELREVPPECQPYFEEHTPSFTGRYVLTFEPVSCFTPSQFPSVPYTTWLGPHHHQIMIEDLR